MKFSKEFLWWLCSVALALCSIAFGIAVIEPKKVNPQIIWITVFFLGTLWWLASGLMLRWRPVRNRYRFRTRVMRWLERQFPFLPAK